MSRAYDRLAVVRTEKGFSKVTTVPARNTVGIAGGTFSSTAEAQRSILALIQRTLHWHANGVIQLKLTMPIQIAFAEFALSTGVQSFTTP